MASRRFARKPPSDLCTEIAGDDGIDPRFDPKGPRAKVSNRKALQLCRQVERALSVALEGELLRDLSVRSVLPAPDSSRLLVTFTYHGPTTFTSSEVLAALHAEQAKLRGIVSAAIHRKKTPELRYLVELFVPQEMVSLH